MAATATALQPKREDSSGYYISIPGAFISGAEGLFYVAAGQRRRIGGPLEVIAQTRSETGTNWGLLVRWKDSDGRVHEYAIPMKTLGGDGADVRRTLLDQGYELSTIFGDRQAFLEYLSTVKCPRRAIAASRIGWHGNEFVLPERSIGGSGTEPVIYQSAVPTTANFATAGTLPEWQKEIAEPAIGNSRLAFSISSAFAGPLLRPAKLDGGGFHLRGNSSTGKSTCLEVAGSVWGPGGPKGFTRTWRATANGLEGTAAAHSDTFLCLDEISEAESSDVGKAAYMLANGKGKSRANQDGSSRPSAEWRLIFLSTGELSLDDKASEDGRGRRSLAGQAVRIVDVPADAECGLGVFETLHGRCGGAKLADDLKTAAQTCFGTAGLAFLERLVENPPAATAAVLRAVDKFTTEHAPKDCHGQINRVAARFGLVAAVGELAIAWGILPWPEGESHRAAVKCLHAWSQVEAAPKAAKHSRQ